MHRTALIAFLFIIASSFQHKDSNHTGILPESDYAEVHIFRPKQYQGGAIVFQVQVNDKTIARLSNGSRLVYRIRSEGSVDFKLKASVFTSKSVNFGIVKGQKYYIKAGYGDGFGSNLSFVPLAEKEGQEAFNDGDSYHHQKVKYYDEDKLDPVAKNVDFFSEQIKEFEKPEGEKPSLGWISPARQNLKTDIGTYSIQLCLKSEAELFKLRVILNNETFDEINDIKGLDKKCSYTYIKNVELQEGKNELRIEMEDQFGVSTFKRTIFYQKLKREYRGLALVVGNSNYFKATFLPNPENDARDMGKALDKLGFEVMQFENLSQDEMKKAVGNFLLKLEKYKTAIFYYAGHGIQHDGRNYLIPIDVSLKTPGEISSKCIDTGSLLTKMELMELETSILILDACRSNPFKGVASGVADISSGLTGTDAPAGSIVAFATAPGKTASDGVGANGLYTQEILKNIYKEDLKVEDLFKRVRINVMDQSNNQQIPWETSSLVKDFYFNPA